MRLFIAEKPSAAKAIASELGITDKGDGFIVCGSDKITWCFGHLLELEEPDAYTSDSVPVSEKTGKKLWRIDELPIVPEKWKIIPKKEAKKQLNIIGYFFELCYSICLSHSTDLFDNCFEKVLGVFYKGKSA